MGWLLSKTDYTSKGTNLWRHDAIFSPNGSEQRCFDLPTDELSLLKFYTLGDDDWKTLGSAADRKTGLALPCNFVPYDIRPCTGFLVR